MVEEKKENKKELKLIDVQKSVRDLVKLEYSADDLKQMVEVSAEITVPNLEDKEQLKIAKDMRGKLRKAEITIEKEAKSYRDFFTKINKDIRAEELDLLKITQDEILRLDKIQEEAEALSLKKKRLEALPARKERLLGIDESGCYIGFDENLLEMDAGEFEAYYNDCVANKNERERVRLEQEAEERRKEQEKILNKERTEFRVEKLKAIGFVSDPQRDGLCFGDITISTREVESDENLVFNDKFASLQTQVAMKQELESERIKRELRKKQLPERRAKIEAIGDNIPSSDDILLGMDDNEFNSYVNQRVADKNEADKIAIENKKRAEEEAQAEKERKEKEAQVEKERLEREEKEKKAELEKKEKYKTFLKEHGWTADKRDQFESREVEGGFELWQKVGFFENN